MRQDLKRRDWLKAMGATSALGLLGACGGGGSNAYGLPAVAAAVPEEAIGTGLLSWTPENQAATFRNVDRLTYTRVIRRGASVMPLPAHKVDAGTLRYKHGGKDCTVDDYMGRNRTAGLLILKNGEIALERYGMGNVASSRWTSFSVAKSATSTLVGAALKDGSIRSLDDSLARYVPQLKGSAYEQNSIRDAMRMSSGVRWIEEYTTTGDSDIVKLSKSLNSNDSGAFLELMRTRPRAAAPGSVYNYNTGESHLLGHVVTGATGTTLSDYLSQKIWAPLGMESDGYWRLGSENGHETAGGNFSVTLRDHARFGLFFLNGGMINGSSVLPTGWRDLASHPDTAVTAYGKLYPDYPLGYGYQWWSFPTGEEALPFHDGAFTAIGLFGQYVYINPKENIVAVVLSAWPSATWDGEFETFDLIGRAVSLLR